jgi:hypothetical protein
MVAMIFKLKYRGMANVCLQHAHNNGWRGGGSSDCVCETSKSARARRRAESKATGSPQPKKGVRHFPPAGAGWRSFLIPLVVVLVAGYFVPIVAPAHAHTGAGLPGVFAIMGAAAIVGASAILALAWDQRRQQRRVDVKAAHDNMVRWWKSSGPDGENTPKSNPKRRWGGE